MDSFKLWQKKAKSCLSLVRKSGNTIYQSDKPTFEKIQNLLEEARTGQFSVQYKGADSLVRSLEVMIAGASRLIQTAQEYLQFCQQQGLSDFSDDEMTGKLSVSEFRSFVEIIQSLPCRIPEFLQLNDQLDRIESFLAEAECQIVTKNGKRDISRIMKLMEFGFSQEIALPEAKKLQEVFGLEKWLQEVEKSVNLLCDPEVQRNVGPDDKLKEGDGTEIDRTGLPRARHIHLTEISQLIVHGESLPQNREVMDAIELLKDIRLRGRKIEMTAKGHICRKSSMEEVRYFFNEVASMNCGKVKICLLSLPKLEELRQAFSLVLNWFEDYKEIIEMNAKYPHFRDVKDLLTRAENMKISVPSSKVDKIARYVQAANDWLANAARTFLKPSSLFDLLEVLLPRPSRTYDQFFYRPIFMARYGPNQTPWELKESLHLHLAAEAAYENCLVFIQNMLDSSSESLRVYNAMADREMVALNHLRNTKMNTENVACCFCENGSDDLKVQCELCLNWYHTTCALEDRFRKVDLPDVSVSCPSADSCTQESCSVQGSISLDAKSRDKAEPRVDQQQGEGRNLCPNCQRSTRPKLSKVYSLLLSLLKIPVSVPEGEALQCVIERILSWQKTVYAFLTQEENPDIRTAFVTYAKTMSLDLPKELRLKLEKREMPDSETLKRVVVEEIEGKVQGLRFRLSDDIRSQMMKLLVEGDLIEVNLQEKQWLWHMLRMSPKPCPRIRPQDNPRADLSSSSFVKKERTRRKRSKKNAKITK